MGSFKIDLLEDGKTYSSNSMHFEDHFLLHLFFFASLCFFLCLWKSYLIRHMVKWKAWMAEIRCLWALTSRGRIYRPHRLQLHRVLRVFQAEVGWRLWTRIVCCFWNYCWDHSRVCILEMYDIYVYIYIYVYAVCTRCAWYIIMYVW